MKETKKTVKKETKKAKKSEDSNLKKEITELEEQTVKITLDILKFQANQRGCKEHLALRSKLHEVHNKLQDLQAGKRI
jgi:hypothetical protein